VAEIKMITQIRNKITQIKGQSSLELALAIFCVFLLLLASVKLCTWAVGRLVVRQEDFEDTRVEAGTPATIGEPIDESDTTKYKKLHFFK